MNSYPEDGCRHKGGPLVASSITKTSVLSRREALFCDEVMNDMVIAVICSSKVEAKRMKKS